MEEEKIIQQRKEKIKKIFHENKPLFIFSILTLVALLIGLIPKLFIYLIDISMYSKSFTGWQIDLGYLYLALAFFISSIACYYKKFNLIPYSILVWITWLAVYIRTLNLAGLRDVTTNGWTLGPDLDPFLFLRWAKYIVANGSLMLIDHFRYVPRGFNTRGELFFLSYLIAYFHKIAVSFGSTSVEQSAAIFPVFMFAITVIAFFLFVRKVFIESLGAFYSNIIALIASFFLSVLPAILPRTIAGIPEKESAAFFFLFMTFYLFISAWKASKLKWQITISVLSGITTACMALVWGGYTYIFVTLGICFFLSFILGQFNRRKFIIATSWLFTSAILMDFFSNRYTIRVLATSTTTLSAILVWFILLVHMIIFNTSIKKYFDKPSLNKVPKQIVSLVVALVLGIIIAIFFLGDPYFILHQFKDIMSLIISPISDRLGVTVAENRQPFFNEWANSFGPVIKSIPVLFWIFLIGSIYLYSYMMKIFSKRERIVTTTGYVVFLLAIIFSRYKSDSVLNGTNGFSVLVYGLGILALIIPFAYYYFQHYKKGEHEKFASVDFGLILVFSFMFLSIVSARAAVRLIMMLVPPLSIIVAYFVVVLFKDSRQLKDSTGKKVALGIFIVVAVSLFYSGNYFYQVSESTAQSYIPSIYSQQWQKAMSWVRENTPETAVFGHWWDYGYWVQSIGERATVLDGGNTIPYWNYLMGRYALTGTSDKEALEFLYAHNTTHFLIDSSDIGKYSAFSSIGSDENYDRASWIPAFTLDSTQTQEKKNSTVFVYRGQSTIDTDLMYDINGTKVFLPANRAVVVAILVEEDYQGKVTSSPQAVIAYQNNPYQLPLRYAYDSTFKDFGSGVESGIFIFPRIAKNTQGGSEIQLNGALLYLSNRTVKSQLARLYLYKEDNQNFKLVHSEDDFVVAQLKAQNGLQSDFVLYDSVRGPIRIWEINYPSNMAVKPEFLLRAYPNKNLELAK